MTDIDNILKFAEQLIFRETNIYCSELQQSLLLSVLQGERKTYEQIADDCGYSVTYIRQDIAPKLWQIFSHALNRKVTKANVRTMLEQEIEGQLAAVNQPVVEASTMPSPTTLNVAANIPPQAVAFEPAPGIEPQLLDPIGSSPPDSLPANILLVDDQPQNLRLLSDLLEEQGYEVQEAINGPVALQAVSAGVPDLILLDIHMPEMDGYTVCQQLKASPQTREVPVIFISAVDEAWDKLKAFSVGGADYITKPFKVVEVLARVKSQLAVHQLQRHLRTQNVQLQELQTELKTQNAQLQQAIQELQRLAVIDQVTQVASRYRFDQYLQSEWQRAMQQSQAMSLMLCHVDQFEAYQQRHGYQAGDRCLYQIAQTIKRVVQRPEDLVCRYGGAIFTIVLPHIEPEDSTTIANTILAQVSALDLSPVGLSGESSINQSSESNASDPDSGRIGSGDSTLTVSIGMARAIPTPGLGLEDLVERCDRALQSAKAAGGNTIITSLGAT